MSTLTKIDFHVWVVMHGLEWRWWGGADRVLRRPRTTGDPTRWASRHIRAPVASSHSGVMQRFPFGQPAAHSCTHRRRPRDHGANGPGRPRPLAERLTCTTAPTPASWAERRVGEERRPPTPEWLIERGLDRNGDAACTASGCSPPPRLPPCKRSAPFSSIRPRTEAGPARPGIPPRAGPGPVGRSPDGKDATGWIDPAASTGTFRQGRVPVV